MGGYKITSDIPHSIEDIVEKADNHLNLREHLQEFWYESGKAAIVLIIVILIEFILYQNIDPRDLQIAWFVMQLVFFGGLGLFIARAFYLRNQKLSSDLVSLAKRQISTETKLGNRLWSLEDRSPDAIAEVDLNPEKNRFLRVNKTFNEWFGMTTEELNYMSWDVVLSRTLHGTDSVNTINEMVAKRKTGFTDPVDLRIRMKKADGTIIPIRYKSAVVKMNGTYISQVFLEDITEESD